MGLKFLIVFWGLLAFWGFAGGSHTTARDAIAFQPAIQAQSGEVIWVDPTPPAALVGGAVAVCDTDGSIRNVVVPYNTAIQTLLFVQQRKTVSIPQGELLEGTGAAWYDAPWSGQPGLQAVTMARSSINFCDGKLEFIKKDLQYY